LKRAQHRKIFNSRAPNRQIKASRQIENQSSASPNMKLRKFRSQALPTFTLIVIPGIVVWLFWHFSSVAIKAEIIRSNVFGDFYSTHNRLGNLLKIGMTPGEVRSVLGEADIKQTMTNGFRWSYGETGPTAGAICVVDFATNENPHLCFFLNVSHVIFPDFSHQEFGNPLDGGKFDGDFPLEKCWNEWHGKK
jgi:hypothetical protein